MNSLLWTRNTVLSFYKTELKLQIELKVQQTFKNYEFSNYEQFDLNKEYSSIYI